MATFVAAGIFFVAAAVVVVAVVLERVLIQGSALTSGWPQRRKSKANTTPTGHPRTRLCLNVAPKRLARVVWVKNMHM